MFDKALFSLPGMRRVMAALGLLSLLKAGVITASAWLLATVLGNLWNGGAFEGQIAFVAAFLACFLVRQAAILAQDSLLSHAAREQGVRLRGRLLEKAFAGPVGWVGAKGTAHVATSALEGIAQVENYIRVVMPKIFDVAAILPVTLAATFILDWPSGIILAVVVPVIVFYMVLLGRMAKDRASRQYGAYQVMSNHFVDTLRGLPTLKVLGAGKRQTARIFETSERFRAATVKTLRVATLSSVVLDLLATLGVAAVAMMLGFRLVVGQLDLFTGLAVLMLAPEYFAPLREFAGDFHASLDGKNALADILALASEDDGAVEEPDIPAWDGDSTLALREISFTHRPEAGGDGGHEALKGVSFEVRGFQRIGIIGPSGAGKSTLAHMLAGFHEPDGGNLAIDGAPLPPTSLASEAWRRQVLYIPQNPYLFHASLRDNITLYTPDAPDSLVWEAVHAMGLEPLVRQLPDGLDTVIGAGGRGLSGGQAQRIALARALLDRDRRILIFDEPSAHLDIETELELKERMLPLMDGHLVFFATHRLHWMEDMDRVFLLEDGRLREVAAEALESGASPQPPAEPAASPLEAAAPEAAMAGKGGSRRPRRADGTAADGSAQASRMRRFPASHAGGEGKDAWVRPYFSLYRRQLSGALGLGVAALAFAALLMFTAGYLISGTAEARGSILFYYLPIAFVQLFGLGKPLLRYLERLRSHDWVFRMTSSLRVRLYKALERQPLGGGRHEVGELLGMVAEDIGHIQNLYLRTAFPLIIDWGTTLLAVAGIGVFSPWFAGVSLLVLAVITAALPAWTLAANRQRAKQAKLLRDRQYRSLADDLIGASDWIFAGRGRERIERHAELSADTHARQDAMDRCERLGRFMATAMMGAFACLVAWWGSTAFGGAPGGTANWIAAFVLGVFPLVEAYAPLSSAALQADVHRAAIEHLNEFPAVDDSLEDEAGETPRPSSMEVEVRGLRFGYHDEGDAADAWRPAAGEHRPGGGSARQTTEAGASPLFDGMDLRIPAGQRLAILGQSGSGKSTLASLIRGDLAPDAGRVDIGRVPATLLGDAVSGYVGVVPQSPYLFNRTLRENVRVAKPDASDDEIRAVLGHVGLLPLLDRLPKGLDTLVDEAGMRFSGGERHRIALARVLLADTPIILLDEPTVGLDPRTERDVIETLLATTRGKTLIMITHHLQGIDAFDRVVFLERGRIELDGAPAELARTSSRYRRLLSFDRSYL